LYNASHPVIQLFSFEDAVTQQNKSYFTCCESEFTVFI